MKRSYLFNHFLANIERKDWIGGSIVMKKSISILLCMLFVFLLTSAAFAEDQGGISVDQTKIVFNADQDSNLTVPITIKNTSNEEMDIKTTKTDFVIAEDGAFQILKPGTNPNSANDFINCDQKEFQMPANSSQTFEVSLVNGKKYYYPEYVSAILVRYNPTSTDKDTGMLKTYTQIAIAVRVLAGKLIATDIDTSVAPLTVSRIDAKRIMGYGDKKDVSIVFKNSGEITVEPKLTASLSSMFSSEVVDLPLGVSYILPGQERSVKVEVNPTSWFDIYTINFKYDYVYSNKSFSGTKKYSFLVISYQLAIGVILILLGIIAQGILYRKKSRLVKKLLQEQKDRNSQ